MGWGRSSLRAVAGALGVGTMTLYAHTPDRQALERDIVGLLLDEVDTAEVSGEEWDDSVRRVAGSLREMTLRHPRAFPLVAAAPVFESPVLEYAARIRALHSQQGIGQEAFVGMWSVCDAFLTGFMVMLAQAAIRSEEAASAAGSTVAGRRRRAASSPRRSAPCSRRTRSAATSRSSSPACAHPASQASRPRKLPTAFVDAKRHREEAWLII